LQYDGSDSELHRSYPFYRLYQWNMMDCSTPNPDFIAGKTTYDPDFIAGKTTYARETFQKDKGLGPVSFRAMAALETFEKRNFEKLKDVVDFSDIILESLNGEIVEFTQEEKNSRKLRPYMETHIKVAIQGINYIPWVHKADKDIDDEDIFRYGAIDERNLGKRYFYDLSMHDSQKKDEDGMVYFRVSKKDYMQRMNFISREFLKKPPRIPRTKKKEENAVDHFFEQLSISMKNAVNRISKFFHELFGMEN
jgi:hypothetical protein